MCWDCYGNKGGDPYKDFRHGKVEISDFDDEFPYVRINSGRKWNWNKKKPRKKTRPGCVENNFGPHEFVWTTELESEKTLFFKFFGFHKYHREVCCGCKKVRATEVSPKYTKRKDREWDKLGDLPKGEPVTRYYIRGRPRRVHYKWFTWENDNEGWLAYKKAEVEKRGILGIDLDGRFLNLY